MCNVCRDVIYGRAFLRQPPVSDGLWPKPHFRFNQGADGMKPGWSWMSGSLELLIISEARLRKDEHLDGDEDVVQLEFLVDRIQSK